jgi:hypothetical protein
MMVPLEFGTLKPEKNAIDSHSIWAKKRSVNPEINSMISKPKFYLTAQRVDAFVQINKAGLWLDVKMELSRYLMMGLL